MREERFEFGQVALTATVPEGVYTDVMVRFLCEDEAAVAEVATALNGADVKVYDDFATATARELRGEPWKDGCGVSAAVALDAPNLHPKGELPRRTPIGRYLYRRRWQREYKNRTTAGVALLRRTFES